MFDRRFSFAAAIAVLLLSAGRRESVVPAGHDVQSIHTQRMARWGLPVACAEWRITGAAKSGAGWLADRSYQDTLLCVLRCAGPCQSGVLLRAEKTATQYSGVAGR
jgi:hypothetical protein